MRWNICTTGSAELADAPDQMYEMLNDILPTSMDTELLNGLEVTDYQSALAYCRRRTGLKKEQEVHAHTTKNILGK